MNIFMKQELTYSFYLEHEGTKRKILEGTQFGLRFIPQVNIKKFIINYFIFRIKVEMKDFYNTI